MRFHPRTATLWRGFVLGVLFSLWFGLSGLLVIARGDVEAFFHKSFRHNSRRDAFYDLNRTYVLFWIFHSSLTITAVAAVRSRRSDVFAVLPIGPAIGLSIGVLCQQWRDPNWAVFVGVCLIGWIVGTIISIIYLFNFKNFLIK